MPELSILVTGATGFIGSAVVEQFLSNGIPVRTTGRSEPADLPSYAPADLCDQAQLRPLLTGVECVIHCAGVAHQFDGRRSETILNRNSTMTRLLMESAVSAGVSRVIMISSVAVYGGEGVRDETSPCRPDDAYGLSKLDAEKKAIAAIGGSAMRLTVLRIVTVYGEGDPGNLLRLIRAVDCHRFVWIGEGRNGKSVIYRGDVARACLAAFQKPNGPDPVQIYNVSGEVLSIREIVDIIAGAVGRRVLPLRIPATLARTAANFVKFASDNRGRRMARLLGKWLSDDIYDDARFRQRFGFHHRVPFTEGIRREIEWYRRASA